MSQSTTASIPVHLGLILDGNRRWAREQGLPTLDGHKKGYENLKTIAKYAFDQGVQYISAYVFSTENWKRSADEVDYLMKLLIWVSKNEIKELDKHNIRVQFLGEEEGLSAQVIKAMESAEARTKDNTGGTLLLCLNYGGQQEIATAMNKLLVKRPDLNSVTPAMIEEHLYKPGIPSVDLIIRTSGEQRISNFMLWRAAYSELCFVTKHWPAFSEQDLQQALDDYANRHRRFGK
jgi:undecaprenyl diphosphate synthase